MQRYCPCGKQISTNRRLCGDCINIYGTNPQEWPEWLHWMVSDIQRELDFERNRGYIGLDDIEPNGNGGYRAKRELTLRGCRPEMHLYQDRNKY